MFSAWVTVRYLEQKYILLDYTVSMNQFLRSINHRFASKKYRFARFWFSYEALGIRFLFFWFSLYKNGFKRQYCSALDPRVRIFMNSPQYEASLEHVSDGLLYVDDSLSSATAISLRYMLRSLNANIIASLPKDVLDADQWVFFSGRLPIDSTLRLLAKHLNIQTDIYEGGALPDSHLRWRDMWDASEWRQTIQTFWHERAASNQIRDVEIIVDEWKRGASRDQLFYAGHQKEILGKSSKKAVVSFFTSHEYEMPPDALERDLLSFNSQREAIDWVRSKAKEHGFHLIIKEHPSPKDYPYRSEAQRFFGKIESDEDIAFFDSKSLISSSSIIDQSDLCITFGSTISIDIVNAQKPLLILGPNFLTNESTARYLFQNRESFFLKPKNFVLSPEEFHPYLFFFRKAGYANFPRTRFFKPRRLSR